MLWRTSPKRAAARALETGRAALARGDRAGAIAAFAAAVDEDRGAFCADWGLVPLLDAEGRGSFRKRMGARLRSWWQDGALAPGAPLAARLQSKPALRLWARQEGFVLPTLIAEAPSLAALDWDGLWRRTGGERIVIKPANASSCRGVVVLKDGIDHMVRAPVGPDLAAHVHRIWTAAGVGDRAVLVETLITDAEAATRPDIVIPRDTKVFAVAGRAGLVYVVDRNGPDRMRGLAAFDATGRPQPTTSLKWPHRPEPRPPSGFARTIVAAERLSALVPHLLRLDFYTTPEGPVLGEITAYPSAGLDLTPFARRTLLQMWELCPD